MEDDELDRLLGVVPNPTPKENRRNRRARLAREKKAELEAELAKQQDVDLSSRPYDSSTSAETKVDHAPVKSKEPVIVEKDFAAATTTFSTAPDRRSDRALDTTLDLSCGSVSIASRGPDHVKPYAIISDGFSDDFDHPTIGRNVESHPPPESAAASSQNTDDLAHRMLQSMLESLSIKPAPPSSSQGPISGPSSMAVRNNALPESIQIKQEDTAITVNDEVQADEHSVTNIKTPKDYHVIAVKTRLPGSRRRRVGYRVIRSTGEGYTADMEEGMETDATIPEPEHVIEPPTPAQRSLQNTFSHDTLSQIETMAQIDNTHGSQLPLLFRDIFTTLSDHTRTVAIANHLRHQLDLPPLSTRTKRVALHRTIAKMRLELYTELVSALVLPLAPLPLPCTDDEEEREKVERISFTPSSLTYLVGVLPNAYPKEKYSIIRFMADPDAPYGERKGRVEWTAGIGHMVGGDPYGPGFRRSVTNDSLVCVFVDYSNILFGLVKHLDKKKATFGPTQDFPRRHNRIVSLPVLSLLLRRGRPSPQGSLHLVASSPLYQNFDPLVRLGWEVSVLKRVEVPQDELVDSHATEIHTKGQQQASLAFHANVPGPRKFKEQGVDEILHLKILQMLNTRPTPAPEGSTIVLATGDAACGQFNRDGFPGAVREAIKRGWTVELWSFSSGLSSHWREVKKKEKWETKFTIRTFDQWADYMVEVGDPHP